MEGCYVAGADPELMIRSPKDELLSAIGLVPGTKKRPKRVSGGAVQRDNVMAEFNVNPSGTSDEFEENFRAVLGELSRIVSPNRLAVEASAEYPESALKSKEAKVFGCDPDFDSWSLRMNQFDSTCAFENFRSAGGHFHIGYKKGTKEMLSDDYGKIEVVKMLDIFMGIPSIFLDSDPSAPLRRKLYGRAGSHRPKKYGVEYRALGNFWVRSPALVHIMYELAHLAVGLTLEGESPKIIKGLGETRIQNIINRSNKRSARAAFKRLFRYLPATLVRQMEELDTEKDLYSAWAL